MVFSTALQSGFALRFLTTKRQLRVFGKNGTEVMLALSVCPVRGVCRLPILFLATLTLLLGQDGIRQDSPLQSDCFLFCN